MGADWDVESEEPDPHGKADRVETAIAVVWFVVLVVIWQGIGAVFGLPWWLF